MSYRLKAFGYHLIISLLIAGVSAFLVFYVWYPDVFAKAVGVTDIYLLMLTVDVIAGPLMTLVLAKKGKKGLKFDLTCIAIVQAAALLYGSYHIFISRPAWVVFNQVRFDVVQANDIDQSNVWQALEPYQKPSITGPNYASVRPAKDAQEKNQWLFYELSTGFAPSMRPEYYEPLDKAWSQITQIQLNTDELKTFNDPIQTNQIINRYQKITGWLPLTAYERPMTVLVNTDDKKIVAIVDLKPY